VKLVVTGATGYIGRRLIAHALENGHEVVAASRRRLELAGAEWMPFILASTEDLVLPPGTQAVIHLAADTSATGELDDGGEILTAQRLMTACRQSRAKMVFVSSQTARPDAPTRYGRIKWRIEQDVLAAGGWVVRAGLVYGGSERGLFGTLVKFVRNSPILPMFIPAPRVQPIHVIDLSDALLRIAERDDLLPGVLCIASPEPVAFDFFLKTIARVRIRRQRIFIAIPTAFIKIAVGAIRGKLFSRLRLERLFSLFDLPRMYPEGDLKRLQMLLRTLPSGMHVSGNDNRRCLLREGKTLLTYILKKPPSGSLLRRYVRAVEKLRGGELLYLPAWTEKMPAALALLDGNRLLPTRFRAEIAWRIDSATTIAEASIQGAYRFLGLDRVARPALSVMHILQALVQEIVWRALQPLSALLLKSACGEKWGAP
jgi:NADH dehydrogenase